MLGLIPREDVFVTALWPQAERAATYARSNLADRVDEVARAFYATVEARTL